MSLVPSRASNLYAPFEHTWLKHRVLAQLKENRETWILDEAGVPAVLEAIPSRIERLRLLLVGISEALSPVDLIDKSPVSALPVDARAKIRSAVNSAFLEAQVVQPLMARIEEKMNYLNSVSRCVADSWLDREKRSALLDEVGIAAEQLRDALLALPPDIIFP